MVSGETPDGSASKATAREYFTLADLEMMDEGKHLNLMGIVVESTQPRKTRGTDYLVNLTVTDESFAPKTVDILVFGDLDKLPIIRKVNDIIRINRMYIQKRRLDRDGRMAKMYVTTLKRFGSAALFDQDATKVSGVSEFVPYYSSRRPPRSCSQLENDIITTLQAFALETFSKDESNLTGEQAWDKGHMRLIKDVRPHVFFDLSCLILHKVEHPEDGSMRVFVWDSTDSCPLPKKYELSNSEYRSCQDLEVGRINHARIEIPSCCYATTAKSVGSIVPVIFLPLSAKKEENEHEQAREIQKQVPIGSWVKFRNIYPIITDGQLQLLYLDHSTWALQTEQKRALDNEATRVEYNQVSYWSQRESLADNGLSAVTPEHEDVRFHTLREVLACKEAGRKFRCRVRCVDYEPRKVEDFCWEKNICPIDSDATDGEYVYAVVLRLEDATDSIDALLCGEDAVRFFATASPSDLRTNQMQAEILQKWMDLLTDEGLGLEDYTDPEQSLKGGPSWIDCCLFSYSPGDPSVRRECPLMYRIFDTILRCV